MHFILLGDGHYRVTVAKKFYYFIPTTIKDISLKRTALRPSELDSIHLPQRQSLLCPLRDQITLYFCRQGECKSYYLGIDAVRQIESVLDGVNRDTLKRTSI